ncbi:hypothetical protein POM88_018360 [Heracleum sosnowskyi]|uniref:Uncharacterized protein n=1 Tax=Heracleum sosnowskyi TaxID=360622 RepID=A0AAD8MZ66_9APIA|nr:hypothetical protein POM88_018360 [Heracleum sosnowskyi]
MELSVIVVYKFHICLSIVYPKIERYEMEEEAKSRLNEDRKDMFTQCIKDGDIIDLQDLLFTKNRDYLVKNNNEQVRADQCCMVRGSAYGTAIQFAHSGTRFIFDPDRWGSRSNSLTPAIHLLLQRSLRRKLPRNVIMLSQIKERRTSILTMDVSSFTLFLRPTS